MMFRLILLFVIVHAVTPAIAAKRVALLIGNQDYRINSLDLETPALQCCCDWQGPKAGGFRGSHRKGCRPWSTPSRN